MSIIWLGANPNAQIIAEQEVSNYFTWFGNKDKKTIHAKAFRKIIYKNIYPHIDVEYSFPANKAGFKYNIILHKEADPSMIKMQYNGAEKMYQDGDGNVVISSAFGDFIDHAPLICYNNGAAIPSTFELQNKTTSFRINAKTLTLSGKVREGFLITIDPWVIIPSFSASNKAYDIDWDYHGNVYAYGGDYSYFQVIKLNKAGEILWVSQNSDIALFYGDFAVDRIRGNVYLAMLFNSFPMSHLIKLDAGGNEIARSSSSMLEYWRIAYNSFTNQGVIGGGGTINNYDAATYDADLISIVDANVLSTNEPQHDVALLALDDTNCFMLTVTPLNASSTIGDNTIIKTTLSNLFPLYVVPSDHYFVELASVKYYRPYSNSEERSIGFNGMAKSKRYLYTYDGANLKKWNPRNGTLIKTVTISESEFEYGGIAADECDNIYLGAGSSIQKYDSTLSIITSFTAPDTVYDVALGVGGNLYACGKGFVISLAVLPSSTLSLSINTGKSTCAGNDGSARVNVTGGSPPFAYLWTKGGQTTSDITGLVPGKYPVLVFKNNSSTCTVIAEMDTAVVLSSSGFSGQSNSTNPSCFGKNNGTATETIVGGVLPYTYLWMPGGQSTQTAANLAAGTYTLTVKDAIGCQTTDQVTIKASSAQPLSVSDTMIRCNPPMITLSVLGGTMPYTFLWTPGTVTTQYVNVPYGTYGTYLAIVTDARGCTEDRSITIPKPWYVSSINVVDVDTCEGNKGAITIDLKNDFAYSINYSWDSVSINITDTTGAFSRLNPGEYKIRIYDDLYCKDTTIDVVIKDNSSITVTASPENVTVCNGVAAKITTNGANTYTWIPPWGLTFYSDSMVAANPNAPTTYMVTGKSTTGCMDTQMVVVSLCSELPCGEVFVPTAFSPNNDKINDVLYVNGNCIDQLDFKIYDRWGNMVFESVSLTDGWDGTYKKKSMNPAIFVYYLEAVLTNGEPLRRKGVISLMR